jgi:hypothetical protein
MEDMERALVVIAWVLGSGCLSSSEDEETSGCPDPGAVCGDDDRTYPDRCAAEAARVTIVHVGRCTEEDCACGEIYAPVCATDGVTYTNACVLACAGATAMHAGECGAECVPACAVECGTSMRVAGCDVCACVGNCSVDGDCAANQYCDTATPTGGAQDSSGGASPSGAPLVAPAMPGVCRVKCSDVSCNIECPGGFASDENGCATCECAPVPCTSDSQCREGEFCDFSSTGAGASPPPPCSGDGCDEGLVAPMGVCAPR